MIKNNKFIEFILKYDNFYNCLSEHNKKLISDLDNYEDLYLYTYGDFFHDYYIYIGNKQDNYYLCKCNFTLMPASNKHIKACLKLCTNISNSSIIVLKSIECFKKCFNYRNYEAV